VSGVVPPNGFVPWRSDTFDDVDEIDDIDDDQKYVQIPDKRELDLGRPLVLAFARQFLAHDFDEIRRMFARKGAHPNLRPCWFAGAQLISGTNLNRRPKMRP
jgi:hypothetical protein